MIVGRQDPCDYSVVIPSYQPGKDLLSCLSSVAAQNVQERFEVIVVDSSPRDPGQFVKNIFPKVYVKHLKERTFAGKARSIGAKLARGCIIFFTDTDCIVPVDWIQKLLSVHINGYKVAGGSVKNGTSKSVIGTSEYLLEFNEVNPHMRAREVRALPSCNLSVNAEIFKKVGYFPDFLKGEDTLFCEKIILSGEKIFFKPDVWIEHRNRTKFVKYVKNQVALGEGAVEARRRADLHGHYLIEYPFLLPFVPLVRTIFIANRFLRSGRKYFFSYLLHYPVIFIGLIAHVWGFIRGPYRSGISTEMKKI